MNKIKTPVTVGFSNCGAEVFLVDAEGKHLCSAISGRVAREIERAVNAHEALVQASQALDWFGTGLNETKPTNPVHAVIYEQLSEAIEKARVALAAAGKKGA